MPAPRSAQPERRTDRIGGRQAASRALRAVFERKGYAGRVLAELRASGRLEQREAALAQEIALGTLRHTITIRHVLSRVARFNPRTVSPALQGILYSAAYQIIWMDRVPAFAAVDEAVRLARRFVRGRSGGMVNAILRNLTRAIAQSRAAWKRLDPQQVRVSWDGACAFQTPVLPEAAPEQDDALKHLAAAVGERLPRFKTLVKRFDLQPAEAVAWASQAVPPVVLQRNALRFAPRQFAEALLEHFGNDVDVFDDTAYLSPHASPIDNPLFRDGMYYVQDATAHLAARLLEARPGERVLDLCAAPGGKSITLATTMRDRGEILACDVSADRLRSVQDNANRLGVICIRTHALPEREPDSHDDLAAPEPGGEIDAPTPLREPFDAAIVDVPCSNSGVVARRPEARLRLTPARLKSLVQLQRRLIRRAAACVRPGGRLVYSTCSIEPQENEDVVTWFLAGTPGWRLEHQELTLPMWGPSRDVWRDGGFAALLARQP